ncbi:MAG: hypothetical protein VX498_14335 [Myxococcota bacterium]|nr:hypothetical protein [Myxococcota bacterium]
MPQEKKRGPLLFVLGAFLASGLLLALLSPPASEDHTGKSRSGARDGGEEDGDSTADYAVLPQQEAAGLQSWTISEDSVFRIRGAEDGSTTDFDLRFTPRGQIHFDTRDMRTAVGRIQLTDLVFEGVQHGNEQLADLPAELFMGALPLFSIRLEELGTAPSARGAVRRGRAQLVGRAGSLSVDVVPGVELVRLSENSFACSTRGSGFDISWEEQGAAPWLIPLRTVLQPGGPVVTPRVLGSFSLQLERVLSPRSAGTTTGSGG